ncbi:uncharacterized protein YPO0396 [Chitinophaga skermanii]|uniref:Uncharacterized protein YPO0396 n=1 Tax=Chitinophaga skermanii TaxID=331697 RepID=A0A327Q023_9BACT|nr:ATP-binding protein [Chitinophaga skermanii]RAI97679.1 uncharacterized protein YPO0396 [Chitinophaga skermanii]
MSTLFSNNNTDNGYRLRYLEVFNWGTFNGKVYKLQPDGRTSLLTGANGSGKTTLIDALLTILVPTGKRFYNQSSGAESKKERDENSYFWGYHGKTFSEEEEKSKIEQLRQKAENPYSVLLACFQNSGTHHTISLIQVRWYSNGSLQKIFLIAPYLLNINEHFGKNHFDIRGDWKKKLKNQFPKTELYNSFKEYASRFSDLFGLKDKALSLFSQTVGIKVLGDLTNFIRQEMLEESEAEEQFRSLYEHYSDLLISHKAIQKDEKQLELLTPIIIHKDTLYEQRSLKTELDFVEEQMPFYLNKKEYDLLVTYISKVKWDTTIAQEEKRLTTERISELDEKKVQLITQKAALNIDHQVTLLNKDIEAEIIKRNDKSAASKFYEDTCKQLKLDFPSSSSAFNENYKQAEKLGIIIPKDQERLSEQKTRYKIEQESTETKINELQKQISSLLERRNRIPEDLVQARKRLTELLDITEVELPFAGELIKVKPAEQKWEDAIERLLHNFSMQLLVPEKFIKAVNHFIYNNDLQTKLVYQKIEKRIAPLLRWSTDENDLVDKLEFKDSIYKDWITNALFDRFNYYCTDDLDVFYGSQKAITSNGLMRNVNRHEKDDRPGKWHKGKYRLGWDNRETIKYLQQQKHLAESNYQQISDKIREITPRIDDINKTILAITNLLRYRYYDEIDWQRHAKKLVLLNEQLNELKKSSHAYEQIVELIKDTERILQLEHAKRDRLVGEIKTLNDEYINKNARLLSLDFKALSDTGSRSIQRFLQEEKLELINEQGLSAFENEIKQIGTRLKSRQRTASETVNQLEQKIIKDIAAFVHPEEKIIRDFPSWHGDVINISADLKNIEEIEELYNIIQTQRLVKHKKRFREYMDKSMLDALTSYRTWLNTELDKIKDMIEELNIPLKKITFNRNPDTYLQLEHRPLRGENEINIFRGQLSDAIPNALDFATQQDDLYREQVFEKIKHLITELQKEETWRRKVSDVRNWLTFSAREYSMIENKAEQYHDNTASYSGGQKAQFTYAILGAAIAHQFGIFQQGRQHKSLRFITVDEAFSRLDPEKSRFLMEFCEQLNLQILVVTPLDKINIAEPYIHAVHFVEIKNKKNSVLYNLTMEQYYEQGEKFKQISEESE